MTHPTTAFGEAHGKIILLGEHSVVYGEPSIAIPFQAAKVVTTVTKSNQGTRIECDFYHGLLKDMPELLDSLKETIRVCLTYLDQVDSKLTIQIDSHIPAERGMGSSAAVSVATTRALFNFFNQPLTQKKLLEIVAISEKIAHGNPSGLDALMTSTPNPCYFVKGQDFELLNMNLDGYLVVGDTGVTGQTKQAVNSIAQRLSQDNNNITKNKLSKLGDLARQGRYFLEHNEASHLGENMTLVHKLLDELGTSSCELNQLVHTALTHQALGAKLTGGGRGGCMIALAENQQIAQTISDALLTAGAKKTWIYEMRGN